MKCNYITIEREYGSGGTKIARRLAEECGIACYGAEILEAVSRKMVYLSIRYSIWRSLFPEVFFTRFLS